MTTGDSLITIAIIGGLIYGIRLIHNKKKWKLVGKILGGLILLGLLIGGGVYAYQTYSERPKEVTELAGISLGMKKVDVTLIKGQPSDEIEFEGGSSLNYKDYSSFLMVNWNTAEGVYRICSSKYSDEIFGLGKYNSYNDVVKKLGQPAEKSINTEGTRMIANYPDYNVAFGVNAGEVDMACVTSRLITFIEEYNGQ
ncbi:MAG: hypothetical protein H6779_00240 [Candidatus Nomurabacteria bacterium]|nr:MAG: hypothetical protein H6779_00240 [Candidatus Nomurabacteria bacterium]